MKSRTLYILLAIGFVLSLVYPKVQEIAKRKQYQNRLNKLPKYAADFSAPQGAILCLEDAYRGKDIEAAAACRDFHLEAALMVKDKDPNIIDEKALIELADVLEVAFRKGIEQSWPDFNGLESYFESEEPYCDNVVCVKEICRFPDSGYSHQQILVGKTDKGWRVLYPLD